MLGCNRKPQNMVVVPEGEFMKGEPGSGSEKKIFLKVFYIDKFEVTNKEYKQFVDKTKHREPKDWALYGYREELNDYPVVYVSFEDASEYCKWSGKRLPTEDEWEKAARGTDARIYPWGNEFEKDKSNTSLSGIVETTKVGTYKEGKSPFGLYDMAGNVWEWTSSGYENNKMSVKGGSWGISHQFAKTFARSGYDQDTRINNLGFRCARDK